MRKNAPVHVIVYHPKTDEGKRELAAQVAAIHAESARACIAELPCPAGQKVSLAESVALQHM